jgi:hypothetical protein
LCVCTSLKGGGCACCRQAGQQRALHVASAIGHLDAARVLLDAGVQMDVHNGSDKRPVDVACAARSLVVPVRWRYAAAPPRRHAQVCNECADKTNEPTVAALLAAAASWCRRLPVTVACCGGVWE